MDAETDTSRRGLPDAEHQRYGRIFVALGLAGTLFLAGQGLRWWQEHRRAESMAQTLHEVYRRALNADPGRSPYGRLQFELGKLKAQSAQRLDMVELLAALSRLAPEGVRIRDVSMATASGVATGLAATPEDLRRYQATLAAEAYFDISLAKADMLARPVRFELEIKARDRAAPPGEDQ